VSTAAATVDGAKSFAGCVFLDFVPIPSVDDLKRSGGAWSVGSRDFAGGRPGSKVETWLSIPEEETVQANSPSRKIDSPFASVDRLARWQGERP